ncbi:MAG: carbohydrate ABC transporter permease [Clostridia bacterium]|nr:carbohydrate ABC transporter permease [Clostridia bacterium]
MTNTQSAYKAYNPKIVKTKKIAGKSVISILRFFFLFGISFVIIYPILSMICGSFMSVDDLVDITVKYFPKNFTFDNYVKAAKALNFPDTLITSVIIFGITSLLQAFSCTLVGYGLARFKFKLNGLIFICVIIQLLIPPDTIMLTRYIEFRYFDLFGLGNLFGLDSINLTSTALPLYVLGITGTGLKNGLFIFMLRQYFKGLPKSLEEAAYVDGCNPFRAFVSIMLPCAKTMMVTIFLFSFVWLWTDMTVAPTLTTSDILVNMTYMIKSTMEDNSGGLVTSLLKNSGVVLIILPVVIVYLVCQKAFIQGIESSGITGT